MGFANSVTSSTNASWWRNDDWGFEVVVEYKPEPLIPPLNITASMLRSWVTWVNWKRTIPMVWEKLLPYSVPPLQPIRIYPRERRHVQGHSPRRRSS